jgi:hypothetical protein
MIKRWFLKRFTNQKPLKDEEIKMKWSRLPTNTKDPIIRFARAIEKAHGIGVDDEN